MKGRVSMGNRSWEEWIAQYEGSHRNTVNRACHKIGIPAIAVAIILSPVLFVRPGWWWLPTGLFAGGWALQFLGHAFEGKPPEFFHDYRFLLVGLRWWIANARR
jgi:uncharacterized membrane protein YGL010W